MIGAGDLTALEVGVVIDLDVIAACAGIDAALLLDALVGAVDVAALGTALRRYRAAVAERRYAQAGTGPVAALLTVIGVAVLLADDVQIAPDVGLETAIRRRRVGEVFFRRINASK